MNICTEEMLYEEIHKLNTQLIQEKQHRYLRKQEFQELYESYKKLNAENVSLRCENKRLTEIEVLYNNNKQGLKKITDKEFVDTVKELEQGNYLTPLWQAIIFEATDGNTYMKSQARLTKEFLERLYGITD